MKNKIFLIVIILIGVFSNIFPQTLFRNAIFLNRSVGNHIWQHAGASTDVPTEIAAYNTAHGYTGADAVSMIKNYPFPFNHDNEWYNWHHIFEGDAPFWTEESNSLYGYINGTTYDIIIMKTCYPASDIFEILDPCPDTTARYAQRDIGVYKWHLRRIVKIMEAHPDKFFSIWTLIPQYQYSDVMCAGYALWFSTWMKDTLATGLDATYGPFPDNVYIFDYFRKIADGTGHAPLQYVDGPGDDHPSALASELIAPQFVQEVFDAAIAYEILPVELISFTASIVLVGVELNWSTATELNNDIFEIQKKTDNGEFIAIGFVKGHGTSTQKNDYSFIDKNTNSGKYLYRLKQIDFNGNYEYSKVVEVDFNPITTYALEQNYPNPFNPSTEINFTLAKSRNITLKVYNISGSEVATLVDGFMTSGKHSVKFNSKDSTSGIYFYRLKTDNFSSTRKMLLIK